MKEVKDDLDKIFKTIFKEKNLQTIENLSAETYKKWDSISHVNLILSLESKFKINIDEDDALNLMSYSKILKHLKNKL